jgi:nucleoside-diphosphate-sugar epimerase
MKILVTGGGGFQGSHLTESLLQRGHQVTILNTYSDQAKENLSNVLGSIEIIWGSVTDKELVEKSVRGHDAVFHLAARVNVDESLADPIAFFYANILGTGYILEAIRHNQNRLILTSTCEVYGDGHDLRPGELLDETAELRPNSPYAASKAAADRLCHSYVKSFGINATIVRPFNIFGERQKAGKFGALIAIFTEKALRGEPLTVFGDGSATRDYTNITDLIGAYNLVLDHPEHSGRSINFASGVDTSVKDIAYFIANRLNVGVEHGPARPGEVTHFPADISFARSLGYAPRVSVWDGIDRYIAWARDRSL